MSSIFELFVTSPRAFLAMLSSKLFNEAIAFGLTDVLAGTIDVAVQAMGGARPTAALFSSPSVPLSNVLAVLQSPNLSGAAARDILSAMVDAGYYDKVLAIMTLGRPDASYTASTTLTTGINIFRNLSIGTGVTLTLGASPCVLVADTITNSGTITTNVIKAAGGAPAVSGAGAGGGGRHGIIILARSLTVGTISANGAGGAAGSTVAASGAGGAGAGGLFWEIQGYPAGTGGKGGSEFGGAGSKNAGGGGGGPTNIAGTGYYGGGGGAASVVTYASPASLLADLFKPIIDYWVANVLAKSVPLPRAVPALGGSGGGGGGAYDGYSAGGGGGGGGGQIVVYATSITAGTITASGGPGGSGGAEGSFDTGGGGGGGGVIYVFYKSLSGTFSFNVAGGGGGGGDIAGAAGTAGSAATFVV
jgi:hypothetical protein